MKHSEQEISNIIRKAVEETGLENENAEDLFQETWVRVLQTNISEKEDIQKHIAAIVMASKKRASKGEGFQIQT